MPTCNLSAAGNFSSVLKYINRARENLRLCHFLHSGHIHSAFSQFLVTSVSCLKSKMFLIEIEEKCVWIIAPTLPPAHPLPTLREAKERHLN